MGFFVCNPKYYKGINCISYQHFKIILLGNKANSICFEFCALCRVCVCFYVVFYFLGIFLKILFFLVLVLVEIFLIWPLGVMHNLASMLLIDMPIYIINNFAGKELFVENEPSYKKIKSKQIEENDRVANELLLERLEFYANKNFKEYSFKEKIFYWILFFFGIFLGILGIFIIVYSISVASWLYAFMGYYLTLIGNEMKEPALRAKRQKEDLILNQEFNLI